MPVRPTRSSNARARLTASWPVSASATSSTSCGLAALLDLGRLVHHLLVERGAAGGVEQHHVVAAEPGGFDRAAGDLRRQLAGDDRQRVDLRLRPSTASCSIAAGRRMSSEAISTFVFCRSARRLAILAVVVVLPEPCRPTIMMATGGAALRSIGWRSRAQRLDQLVVHDLDDHLAGRDRLDHLDADGLLLYLVDEGARHVERDVGFQQRAAHLAHRRIDVGFRQRAAPRQAIENAGQVFPTGCRTSSSCFTSSFETPPPAAPQDEAAKHILRPRAHRAVGRGPPASQGPGGGSDFKSQSRAGGT